jgi:hypothetical protein
MNNNCEGCFTYHGDEYTVGDCTHICYNDDGKCPCTRCVVKPMCKDACVDYDNFTKKNNANDRLRRDSGD